MKDMFKNLDPVTKKMIKSFGIVIGLFVVLLIGIFVIKLFVGNKVGYEKLENIVENSAKSYFSKNSDQLPSDEGEIKRVTTSELIEGKYMKTMDKYTEDSCSGEVKVTNNGGEYLYITTLDCNGYKTKSIAEVIESSLVDSGDGLYISENEYYYRGENVNNYIKIDNQVYRILGIDANGYIKVFDPTLDRNGVTWDNRYNSEKKQDSVGINDYEKSRLKEYFDGVYDAYLNTTKKYIVKYDWYIGKRSINDGNLSPVESSKTISDYVSTILPSEYARIGLDSDCTSIFTRSCKNYNYISSLIIDSIWTLSSVAENTYENFCIDNGMIETKPTMRKYKVLKSFNISGDNIYVSGDGSLNSPYVIK